MRHDTKNYMTENADSLDFNDFILENDYPCLTGNGVTWHAIPDGFGDIIFTDGIHVYRGPVNIIGGNLVVAKGAIVDGSNIIGWGNNPTVTVQDGGILRNSQAFDGYFEIQQGGRSENNKYFSEVSTGQGINGVSDHDLFYETGNVNRSLKLTQFPDATWVKLGDGAGDIKVGPNGELQFPTIAAAKGEHIKITYNQGGIIHDACFLAGSMIKTIDGEVAVENIKVGDQVFIHTEEEGPSFQSVTWVGAKQCDVDPSMPNDQANYPIRILKNALGNNIPYKDMLVTSEHCLFINGQFIPVRMLVNNRSIYYDQSILSYTYYHIELEKHAVIMADGALTESYLDTGNHTFSYLNTDDPINFNQIKKSWEYDAAAPLVVERQIVEPIFDQYHHRAETLGIKLKYKKPLLTDDMDLHLITDQGEIIRTTLECKNNHHIFILPAAVESVRIMSRSSRPCDTIGPFVDDRRNLGVLIGKISLFNNQTTMTIDHHLKEKDLFGWNNLEPSSCRWTNGNAYLSLQNFSTELKKIMIIQILASGPYIVHDEREKINDYNIAV